MFADFTQPAREIISIAEEEARGFNHAYVGTEHILLALVQDEAGTASLMLRSFGVEASTVRGAVEKMVQCGQGVNSPHKLPLTPRAKQAIAFAREQARYVNLKQVNADLLLLGLLREPEGVAGQALRVLGLDLKKLQEESLKIRLLQMKIVERAVRPIRASTKCKLKMREELLAHLTSIYDEEKSRLKDPLRALEAAQKRFGDPAELASELDSSLPASERANYYIERGFGWRAPESAARYMFRMATQSFLLIGAICGAICIVLVMIGLVQGWNVDQWKSLRPAAAALAFTPVAQFLLGIFYFNLRNTWYGVFGQRQSVLRVCVIDAAIAGLIIAMGFGCIAVGTWNITQALESLLPMAIVGVAVAVGFLLRARLSGPNEINQTIWDCLPIAHER
jgi:hypothetical protein